MRKITLIELMDKIINSHYSNSKTIFDDDVLKTLIIIQKNFNKMDYKNYPKVMGKIIHMYTLSKPSNNLDNLEPQIGEIFADIASNYSILNCMKSYEYNLYD